MLMALPTVMVPVASSCKENIVVTPTGTFVSSIVVLNFFTSIRFAAPRLEAFARKPYPGVAVPSTVTVPSSLKYAMSP